MNVAPVRFGQIQLAQAYFIPQCQDSCLHKKINMRNHGKMSLVDQRLIKESRDERYEIKIKIRF